MRVKITIGPSEHAMVGTDWYVAYLVVGDQAWPGSGSSGFSTRGPKATTIRAWFTYAKKHVQLGDRKIQWATATVKPYRWSDGANAPNGIDIVAEVL